MRFVYVVPAVVLASQACALNFLQARQFEDLAGLIPAQCESVCSATLDILNTCSTEEASDPTCPCTPTVFSGLELCFDCFVEIVEDSGVPESAEVIRNQGRTLIDQLESTCASAGTTTDGATSSSATASSTSRVILSTSSSIDDDSTSTSRTQTVVRPTPSDGADSGDLLGGDASSLTLSLGRVGAAAAAALFLV
ncbi:hypothetical protein BKA70DRAFT_1431219 [Coprinopsis sp. MPI-PUGE-AT-0042]|nr:hypothetical protein BKA70DRAFT_1431219 [Coprinopsis sp. MPI-PUGE-AT-0042]